MEPGKEWHEKLTNVVNVHKHGMNYKNKMAYFAAKLMSALQCNFNMKCVIRCMLFPSHKRRYNDNLCTDFSTFVSSNAVLQ